MVFLEWSIELECLSKRCTAILSMLKVFTFYGVSTVFVKQVGDYSIYYQSFIFLKKKERDYLLKMIVDLI